MASRWGTEAPSWMFTKALNHRQKVLRLYKRSCRALEPWFHSSDFLTYRYQRQIMRARFEVNRNEPDPRKASILLADGCRQLWENKHWKHVAYAYDPYGVAYDRSPQVPEQNIDDRNYTYPEREQFPYYFNTREKRKKELLEHWHKIEKEWDEELDKIQKELPKEEGVVNPQT